MSSSYNTDGMMTFPATTNLDLNALSSIECTIAFDVRDWCADRRSAWIWAIVFGWDEEAWDEMVEKFGWDDEDRKRMEKYHEQWETLKKVSEGLWGKGAQL